jgi:hypothetical protein
MVDVKFIGRRMGKMWVIDFALYHAGQSIQALSAKEGEVTDQRLMRLHERFAHAPLAKLKKLCMNGDMDDVPKDVRRLLANTSVIV